MKKIFSIQKNIIILLISFGLCCFMKMKMKNWFKKKMKFFVQTIKTSQIYNYINHNKKYGFVKFSLKFQELVKFFFL